MCQGHLGAVDHLTGQFGVPVLIVLPKVHRCDYLHQKKSAVSKSSELAFTPSIEQVGMCGDCVSGQRRGRRSGGNEVVPVSAQREVRECRLRKQNRVPIR